MAPSTSASTTYRITKELKDFLNGNLCVDEESFCGHDGKVLSYVGEIFKILLHDTLRSVREFNLQFDRW